MSELLSPQPPAPWYPPPEPPQAATPTPPPRWPWLVLAISVLIAAFGVLFGLGVFAGSSGIFSSTFTMTGSITVYGSSYSEFTTDGEGGCTGTGGYSDMNPGTAVIVADSSGHTIATGELGNGKTTEDGSCLFPITVQNVPAGLSQYAVTVSHRGTRLVSANEARTGLELTLGSN